MSYGTARRRSKTRISLLGLIFFCFLQGSLLRILRRFLHEWDNSISWLTWMYAIGIRYTVPFFSLIKYDTEHVRFTLSSGSFDVWYWHPLLNCAWPKYRTVDWRVTFVRKNVSYCRCEQSFDIRSTLLAVGANSVDPDQNAYKSQLPLKQSDMFLHDAADWNWNKPVHLYFLSSTHPSSMKTWSDRLTASKLGLHCSVATTVHFPESP